MMHIEILLHLLFALNNGCVNSNTRERYFFYWVSEERWLVEIEARNDKCDNQSNGRELRVDM